MSLLSRDLMKLDKANFKMLYDAYHQRIYSFALFLTHSQLLAEEVTQEIFIKIWEHRKTLPQIKTFDAWLSTIVRNQCYTYLNRLSKERLVMQGIVNQEEQVSDSADQKMILDEYSVIYRSILDNLPKQQRKVFILSRQDGIKYQEIASLLGLSINTVKSHMKAALKKVRAELEKIS